MIAVMNEHDLDACVACYSEDARLQDPRFPQPVRGNQYVREGFKYWFDAFLWWLLRTSVRKVDDFARDFCFFSELCLHR